MTKIVGYQHKKGSFTNDSKENVNYDNVILYFVSDGVDGVTGCSVGEVKVSNDKLEAITGFKLNNLDQIINKKVFFNYIPDAKFPKLNSISIMPEKP